MVVNLISFYNLIIKQISYIKTQSEDILASCSTNQQWYSTINLVLQYQEISIEEATLRKNAEEILLKKQLSAQKYQLETENLLKQQSDDQLIIQQLDLKFKQAKEKPLKEQEEILRVQQQKQIQLKKELENLSQQLTENQAKQQDSQLKQQQQIQLQNAQQLIIEQQKKIQLEQEEQLKLKQAQDALHKKQQEDLQKQQQINKAKLLAQQQQQIVQNTFTEKAIVLQQKKPVSQNKDTKVIIEQQIQLEATQPHLVLTRTEHFSDTKQLAVLKQQLNNQIKEYVEDLKVNNKIEAPSKYQVPQKLNAENPEVLFYVLSEQFKQVNKTLLQTKVPSKLNLISLQSICAGDTANCEQYSITLKETPSNTFDKIENDNNIRKQFEDKFIESIALDHNINKENIIIIKIERGSIKVVYEIKNNAGQVFESMDLKELKRRFPGSSPTLKIHKLFALAALSVNDFEPQYNMQWDNEGVAERGPKGNTLNYYFPCGWKGFALNVKGIYGENDKWLGMDQNAEEWCVLFHGTQFGALNQIMQQRNQGGLIAGYRQAYSNSRCKRTNQIIGSGVYFSNHVEVCLGYAQPTVIGNKKFTIVFQARVNPRTLKQCQKAGDIQGKANQAEWDNDYFVVNNSCDIRPYRILLKEN